MLDTQKIATVDEVLNSAKEQIEAVLGVRVEIDFKVAPEAAISFQESRIIAIQQVVCEEAGVTWKQLISPTRKREVCSARHLFCFFAKRIAKPSLKRIGDLLGDRDHTTVINSIQVTKDLLDAKNDDEFIDLHTRIFNRLTASNETETNSQPIPGPPGSV